MWAINLGIVMIAGSHAQGQTYVFRTVDMLGAEEYPGAVSTFALTINDSGTIVGGYTDATRTHGFILQNGCYTTLDFPGSAGSYANAIKKVGQIVGEYGLTDPSARSGIHGYLMTGSNSFTPIDFPRDQDTEAQGLNNNGQIVGDRLDSGVVEHGFSFNGTTYSTIDFPGSSLTIAFDINDRGQIVGTYLSQDYKYNSHGYLATPIPGTEQRSAHRNSAMRSTRRWRRCGGPPLGRMRVMRIPRARRDTIPSSRTGIGRVVILAVGVYLLSARALAAQTGPTNVCALLGTADVQAVLGAPGVVSMSAKADGNRQGYCYWDKPTSKVELRVLVTARGDPTSYLARTSVWR